MEDRVNSTGMDGEDDVVIKSPWADKAGGIVVPEMSATEYLLESLRMNHEYLKYKPWVGLNAGWKASMLSIYPLWSENREINRNYKVDAISKKTVLFSELEPLSFRLASGLTKLGFRKGDWLYFVTYEVALIYVVNFGVWRCGGTVRGCFQKEGEDEFRRQMEEIGARFVLCDRETAGPIKRAIGRLSWPVTLLSIGDEVTNAFSVEKLMHNDDGLTFPHDLKIDPKEDVISVPNTSGSTGRPKGAMHTHYNIISFLANMGGPRKLNKDPVTGSSLLGTMGNFSVGAFMHTCMAMIFGYSFITISKFNKHTYLSHIMNYKPCSISLYHYMASWLVRCGELEKHDLSFLQCIICGGSVFDAATLSKLSMVLPHVKITQSYGTSETLVVTTTTMDSMDTGNNDTNKTVAGLRTFTIENEANSTVHLSVGVLFPQVQGKIVDHDTGRSLKNGSVGKFLLKCPFVMKGYVGFQRDKGEVTDPDGWFDTGDNGFFDDSGHLYIVDRSNLIFKYYMHQVSTVEIEAIVAQHPAVLSVAVVAIPNAETTSLARAYIVLKPWKSLTEEEIVRHVEGKTIFYQHLHGGAKFVSHLPINSGGKIDRKAVFEMAMKEMRNNENSLVCSKV